ncbi:hypothetical protein [Paenibacillus sp. FSL H7-0714]|uniref:hypothetical protein n=1 Tax=Paenibacillus sp. FSL H7-0714 TaxID=2954735 RepID=UPI0030F6DE46
MPHTLNKNIDFFIAALSQTYITALQLDPDGMYSDVASGIVEEFSDVQVRLRRYDGSVSHYARDNTKFQRNKG